MRGGDLRSLLIVARSGSRGCLPVAYRERSAPNVESVHVESNTCNPRTHKVPVPLADGLVSTAVGLMPVPAGTCRQFNKSQSAEWWLRVQRRWSRSRQQAVFDSFPRLLCTSTNLPTIKYFSFFHPFCHLVWIERRPGSCRSLFPSAHERAPRSVPRGNRRRERALRWGATRWGLDERLKSAPKRSFVATRPHLWS